LSTGRDCVPNIQGARSQEVALLCEAELREACRVWAASLRQGRRHPRWYDLLMPSH